MFERDQDEARDPSASSGSNLHYNMQLKAPDHPRLQVCLAQKEFSDSESGTSIILHLPESYFGP